MDRHDDLKDYGKLFWGMAIVIGVPFITMVATL